MSQEAQLIAAIGVLWAALQAGVVFAVKWLLTDRRDLKEAYEKRIAELEDKLAGAGRLMERQNDAMALQIKQQQSLIEYFQSQGKLPDA